MATWSFSGVKRPQRGVNFTQLSSAEVKERVELCVFMADHMMKLNFTFRFMYHKHITSSKSTPKEEKLAKECLPFG